MSSRTITKFRNRYRIDSARMRGWDDSSAASYFVTLCIKHRMPILAAVTRGVVRLTRIGEIVAEEWSKSPNIRASVSLNPWVIMPDHIHGIIHIGLEKSPRRAHGETPLRDDNVTPRRIPVTEETPRKGASSGLKPNSLGSIIGQIKSKATKRIWAEGFLEFAWQTRSYDHIIRNQADLDRIHRYTENNPIRWTISQPRDEK